MTTDPRIRQGTPEWFEMVGGVMSDAAKRARLPSDRNVSLVERYIDGVDSGNGLVQGFRFDIVGGTPSYRVGVRPDERGDITVQVSSATARELNMMPAEAFAITRSRYVKSGKIRQDGDLSRLGDWFATTGASIIARTK